MIAIFWMSAMSSPRSWSSRSRRAAYLAAGAVKDLDRAACRALGARVRAAITSETSASIEKDI